MNIVYRISTYDLQPIIIYATDSKTMIRRKIDTALEDGFDDVADTKDFNGEDEAIAAFRAMRPIYKTTSAYPKGLQTNIQIHEIEKIRLDDDGEQDDHEWLDSDAPDADDILMHLNRI